MTVLSDRDIRRALGLVECYQNGPLFIQPLEQDSIRENGVDLRIKSLREISPLFALAVTREIVHLPAGAQSLTGRFLAIFFKRYRGLVAQCGLRSTWARKGFSVPPTWVDAGFRGELTIEIIRHDPNEPWPQPGERFLHLIFMHTTTPVEKPYNGKYQGQIGITTARPDR